MSSDSIHKTAEIISLFLTPGTIILSAVVVVIWAPKAMARRKENKGFDSVAWFMIGVTLGFIAAAFDNFYWGLAWSASYLDHPAQAFLFEHGVYSNIPFRQSLGLAAAFCHVKSARNVVGRWFTWLLYAALISGAALVLILHAMQ